MKWEAEYHPYLKTWTIKTPYKGTIRGNSKSDLDEILAKYIASCLNACEGITDPEKAIPDLLHALSGLLEIMDCECDNTHEANNTVCRVCWAQNARAKGGE